MARIMIANMNPNREGLGIVISQDFAEKVTSDLTELLNGVGAYKVGGGAEISSEFGGSLSVDLELVNNGSAILKINYLTARSKSSYLSCSTLLTGCEILWGVNSKVAGKIKKFYSDMHLNMYRDEIRIKDEVKFLSGAEYSRLMAEHHGVQLIEG